jgi:hypothetical protein
VARPHERRNEIDVLIADLSVLVAEGRCVATRSVVSCAQLPGSNDLFVFVAQRAAGG